MCAATLSEFGIVVKLSRNQIAPKNHERFISKYFLNFGLYQSVIPIVKSVLIIQLWKG